MTFLNEHGLHQCLHHLQELHVTDLCTLRQLSNKKLKASKIESDVRSKLWHALRTDPIDIGQHNSHSKEMVKEDIGDGADSRQESKYTSINHGKKSKKKKKRSKNANTTTGKIQLCKLESNIPSTPGSEVTQRQEQRLFQNKKQWTRIFQA